MILKHFEPLQVTLTGINQAILEYSAMLARKEIVGSTPERSQKREIKAR